MYDILGSEARQGDEEASGEKESSSFRLENDVHKVRQTSHVELRCGRYMCIGSVEADVAHGSGCVV